MALMVALLQEKKKLEVGNLEDQGYNRGDDPMEKFLDDFHDLVINNEDDF